MNTDTHSMPLLNQPPQPAKEMTADAAKGIARDVTDAAKDTYQNLSTKVEDGIERAKEYAQHAVDATKDAAHRATGVAKDIYQSATATAADALVQSKEYVRQNPIPVVIGAFVAGIAIGGMIVMAHHQEPTFRQRYFC